MKAVKTVLPILERHFEMCQDDPEVEIDVADFLEGNLD